MSELFIDATHAGVAGDMLLSALVSLGADPQKIESALAPLSATVPIQLSFQKVNRAGVSALHFALKEPFPEFKHHNYGHLKKLFSSLSLSPKTEALALEILRVIGEAEAKIHHIPLEKVHFHEVGAIDSVVDILGVSLALEQINPKRITCSTITLGFGSVHCSHGLYPVPAPATLEILEGLSIGSGPQPYEMTTPTGAAILKVICEQTGAVLPEMVLTKIGYGAGTRDIKNHPNVLRMMLGEVNEPKV